jgi:solute carrier family 4 (sodium borate transporter), member 11
LLFLLLFLGTSLVGLWLYDFRKTPYLASVVREVISDYSLPLSVLINSLFGSLVFQAVEIEEPPEPITEPWQFTDMLDLPVWAIFAAAGFGFLLSLLFFMDQNISSQMVNSPDNRLRKGSAYHWDMLVVAVINAVLSLFGMPWVHAALPHSPLHVRALADREKFYSNGHLVERVVHVRETRLTALLSHAIIGVSVLAIPVPLNLIPTPVLYGVFLWMSITGLEGSQFWERILLLFTEQAQYPPAHFVRRVRQRRMHLFTFYQVGDWVGVVMLGGLQSG